MPLMVKEKCCCGCSVTLGSQILATVNAITALCAIFTSFFYYSNWFLILAQILYCFASVCASALVFQAIRVRRALLMAPMMLVAIINLVALVIVFIVCTLTSFGVSTSINANVKYLYEHDSVWAFWLNTVYGLPMDQDGKLISTDGVPAMLAEYSKSVGFYGAFSSFFLVILAVWVFIVHFDCFRTLKAGEGYPTAQYHGNDNITVPIYPTYPAPAYDAATAAAGANPAPAYSGQAYDVPPSYANAAATTADEVPVKVPLP